MNEFKKAKRRNRDFKKRKGYKKHFYQTSYCSKEQMKKKTDEIETALEAQRVKASCLKTPPDDYTEKVSALANVCIPGMVYDRERDRFFPKDRYGKVHERQQELQQAAASISPALFLRSRELGSLGIKGKFGNYNSVVSGILGKATAQRLKSISGLDESERSAVRRGCAEALLLSNLQM